VSAAPDQDLVLVARIIAGECAPDEAELVARRLEGDVPFRDRVREHLLLARGIEMLQESDQQARHARISAVVAELLSGDRGSRRLARLRTVSRHVRQRRRSTWRLAVPWLVAALLAVAVGAILWPSHTADGSAELAEFVDGPRAGERLRAGAPIVADDQPLRLRLLHDAQGLITVAPASTAMLSTTPGTLLELHSGRLTCDIAKRSADAALAFDLGAWRFSVVGTAFTLERRGAWNALAVRHGLVQAAGPRGAPVAVAAGQEFHADDAGEAHLDTQAELHVEDFDRASTLAWTNQVNPGSQVVADWVQPSGRPGRALRLTARLAQTAKVIPYVHTHAARSDAGLLGWERGSGIELRVYTALPHRVLIFLGVGPPGQRRYFRAAESAEAQGWRSLRLAWTAFQPSPDHTNDPGAPTRLVPEAIGSCIVEVRGGAGTDVVLAIDDLRLLAVSDPR
jgi:hypothetical protein